MNTNKLAIGALLGFVVYFLGGFLFYTIVFKDIMASSNPGMAGTQRDPDMAAIVIGNLAAAFLLAYIFEKWASIRTWMSGAVAGATIGGLYGLAYDSLIHGTSNLMTWKGVLADVIVYALLSALAGAVIGWYLGYKRK